MIYLRPIPRAVCSVAALWAILCALAAPADDALLILCQQRTVRGEPAGLQAQIYAPSDAPPREAALVLPQSQLVQPMQPLFGGEWIALLTRDVTRTVPSASADSRQELILLRTAPLERLYTPWTSEWEVAAVIAEPTPIGDVCRLILLEKRIGAEAPPRGRVRVVGLRLSDNGRRFTLLGQWDLHGVPAIGAARWQSGQLYVACEGPRSGTAAIVAIDLNSGEQRYVPVKASREAALASSPAALAIVGDGAHLTLLESAFSLERRDGGRTSTVRLLDATTLQDVGPSVGIPGAMPRGAFMAASSSGEVVVNTMDHATGFAYTTAFTTGSEELRKSNEWSFRDVVGQPPNVALSPDGVRMAVAGGKSLLLQGPDSSTRATYQTQDTIEALTWTNDALYVADGPRLRRIPNDSEALSLELHRFNGFVVDMLPIATNTMPARRPHISLGLPPRVLLDADTPGRSRCVLPIALPPNAHVQLTYDERAAPWLAATIDESADSGPRATISLNTQSMQQPGEYRTRVMVRAHRTPTSKPVVVAEEWFDVVATSFAKGTRAVEWQSVEHFGALTRLLSEAPMHLSQRERRGPIAQAPQGSAAVVVRLEDVARGAITRQVLLDYVSGGGGLLVVAGHAPEIAGEGLRRWLEPLGLLIDPQHEVSGNFAIPKTPFALFGMDQLAIASGAYIETTRPMEFSVPGSEPNTSTLAFTQHGYGRLAVLASEYPLDDAALTRGENRRFARALFEWLTGAHAAVRDSDNDGLRDDIEDANGNAEKDMHETDYLSPDTDGDGVWDGVEDTNLNGLVDEGETDPRRADTDGDGLFDGADSDPLPPAGAPAILAVQPLGGPAEGGTFVELTGRNLPVNPQVWFGERRASVVFRADSTRVVAATPPRIFRELTGPMGIRIADPLDKNDYVLKEAYTYQPPSAVTLTLTPIARVQRAYDGYRGIIALSLDIPDVRLDAAAFFLRTDPSLEAMEGQFGRSLALARAGRTLQLTRYGASEFHFVLGPGEPLTGHVELGRFSWRLADPTPAISALRWYVLYPDLRVLWGSNVDVPTNDIEVQLDKLGVKAVPAQPLDPSYML